MKPQTKTWLEMAENDLKAIIQEHSNEMPPKTHNFGLLSKHADLKLPPDMEETLLSLAPHYLGTRYPEDISKLYRQYTFEYVKQIIERTEVLFAWLKNTLTSKK